MTRVFAIAMLSLMILPGAAVAQHKGTPAQQRACRHDVLHWCRDVKGDDAIAACLRDNMGRLSPACKKVFSGG